MQESKPLTCEYFYDIRQVVSNPRPLKRRVPVKSVLIIEEIKAIREMWDRQLSGGLRLTFCSSVAEGQEAYESSEAFDAIVVGTLASGLADIKTRDLIEFIAQDFKGFLIGVSSIGKFMDELADAGCKPVCTKDEMYRVLLGLLYPE